MLFLVICTNKEQKVTDLLIIGGGPAGLFAAFYGGMRQASVTLIESMPQLGGQLTALYPEKYIYDVAGFPKVTAQQLVNELVQQLKPFSPTIRLGETVLSVKKQKERHFTVHTSKHKYDAKAIIITAGIGSFQPRKLTLDGAAAFENTNLHYFIQDLAMFRGKKVLICGGGDSAVDWALMLQPVAQQVTLIHRRDKFRAHEHSVTKLLESNVNIVTPSEITQLHGQERITHLTLTDVKTNVQQLVEVDEVIISFGFISSLGHISQWGLDIEQNAIPVNSRMETSIPGIFAAGDITRYPGKVKLIAVGFGEAPTAVNNAKVYIDPESRLAPGHSSNMKF